MAEEALPIKFKEHVQLTNVGISTTTITNKSLSMESEKFICVLEKINDENQMVIIDMDDTTNSIRRPILAEISANSVIMNPVNKVIAIKVEKKIQILNVESESEIKDYVMENDIIFWKWISADTLAIVTENSVYHWNIEGDSIPQKIFDLHASLSGRFISKITGCYSHM